MVNKIKREVSLLKRKVMGHTTFSAIQAIQASSVSFGSMEPIRATVHLQLSTG